jgi:hypothetical protein
VQRSWRTGSTPNPLVRYQLALMKFTPLFVLCALVCSNCFPAAAQNWSFTSGKNPEGPGSVLDVLRDGKPVARFVHGEGQMKPYMHVFGTDGELLTNSGLDREGKAAGLYPHHRGIFIGWNKITSELGSDDLWHMTKGCHMDLEKVEHSTTGRAATIQARIGWHSTRKDSAGSDLLITETRKLAISQGEGRRTYIDASFTLEPARNLTLDGDLQHAGIHFRASDLVNDRKSQTSYLWEPDVPGPGGKAVSKEFKWCRLLFPLKERWYEALELNAPDNPVEELSWRDYGRFGFFFKKELKKGAPLMVRYRFVIRLVDAPKNAPKQAEEQIAASKKFCEREYSLFAGSTK